LKRFTLFLALFIIWLLLVYNRPYDTVAFKQNLFIGFIVSLFIGIYLGDLIPERVYKFYSPVRIFNFLIYLPVFFWYVILANLDVAYRVLHPRLPIRPGIVKVKTKIKSDTGRVALANSITLTPGTLSVDMVGDTIFVHWIYVRSEDVEEATKIIVKRFERYLMKIFD